MLNTYTGVNILTQNFKFSDEEFKPELLKVFKNESENLLILSKCLLYLPEIRKKFSLLYCQVSFFYISFIYVCIQFETRFILVRNMEVEK